LIIAAPKKLLRHKLAVSSIEDFSDWKRVSRQINETDLRIHENGEKVNKVILCSG
jgi:2-oxoglutarate dehydrogenase complex dehydrogenase (E1) component-like enzyme